MSISIYAIWKDSYIFPHIHLIIPRFNLMIANVQWIILFPVVCLLSISLENEHMTTLLFYN